ncbi:flavodoxin reductase [Candidatus Pacearchaeota archaeon]|jgi:hypothetical protein|nr:flavodoxin reductase [Candidatus Pacearchaeota archaeon]|tara:strand:+ start:26660 stop:27325 length:666 start_codon:yes stop_codon:yes gene_type:complete
MTYKTKILEIEDLTHDVKKFVVEKPEGYNFIPGQHTIVSINQPKWENKKRLFTFSSSPEDPLLEFIIKVYPKNKGVTEKLHTLVIGDELIIGKALGILGYKNKGIFITAGTGIAPFVSILKQLKKEGENKEQKLFFSNKTCKDIIMEDKLKEIFKNKIIFTLTREDKEGYNKGRIDESFLRKNIDDFNQNFYICGSREFMKNIKDILKNIGIKEELIIIEK